MRARVQPVSIGLYSVAWFLRMGVGGSKLQKDMQEVKQERKTIAA